MVKKKINIKMSFAEVLEIGGHDAAEVLFKEGMHCVGCPMSSQESLKDGCLAHGLDVDEVVKKLNEKLRRK